MRHVFSRFQSIVQQSHAPDRFSAVLVSRSASKRRVMAAVRACYARPNAEQMSMANRNTQYTANKNTHLRAKKTNVN